MNTSSQTLAFKNPKKEWVVQELEKLRDEWAKWQREVNQIEDHPYDRMQQSAVMADGAENLKRHRILQAKTIVFLDNNLEGHGFVHGRDGSKIDRDDLRLKIRVQHRLDDLDELRACLAYAKVPDSYWTAKAKELVDKIANKAPEAAIEVAARYLKGLG